MALKIAIVGAGNVGTTLGKRLSQKHSVKYGVRDPSKHPVLDAAPVPVAVEWADAIILATPGFRTAAAAKKLADSLGPGAAGKVVVDITNPLSPWPNLEVLWDGNSAGELLQAALPSSSVYKAFNTLGLEHMAQPGGELAFGSDAAAAERGPITMLFAGAKEKKDVAAAVVADVGFAPLYVGPIRYARNLEAMAELWIHAAVGAAGANPGVDWGRSFVFQVVGAVAPAEGGGAGGGAT